MMKENTHTQELVHIIPLGHEIDRAVKPFDEKYKAHRVHLLSTTETMGKYTTEMTGEQKSFQDIVKKKLEAKGIDVKTYPSIDTFDTLELAEHISKLIIEEKVQKGNRVYINISCASKLSSVVSTLAAMAHNDKKNNVTAYYVMADKYTYGHPDQKKEHGHSVCDNVEIQEINNLPLQLPEEIQLQVLAVLYERFCNPTPAGRGMFMVEIEQGLGNRDAAPFKECRTKDYLKMSRSKRINCHMKLKGVLEKLEDKGYINSEKDGKYRYSTIEPTGEFIVHISGLLATSTKEK
jgi:hypothetical protein